MNNKENVEGLIAFYHLQDWWFSSFTKEERDFIDNKYQPMGGTPHALTKGKVLSGNQPAPEFLNGLNSWFRTKEYSSISDRIHLQLIKLANINPINNPGYYKGRHFTTYVLDIKKLKETGDTKDLENLLIEIINATEAESKNTGLGVAPAYYEELSILYRKQKELTKEIEVLERFAKQIHARGVMPEKLLERLKKAKEK
jgi:hypothetical protein